jgi:hypothetical protein
MTEHRLPSTWIICMTQRIRYAGTSREWTRIRFWLTAGRNKQ